MDHSDLSKVLRSAEKAGEELTEFGKKIADTSRLSDALKEFSEEWKKTAAHLASAGLPDEVTRRFKDWGPSEMVEVDDERHFRRARRIASVALGALAVLPVAAGILALQHRLQRLRIKAEMLCLRARLGKMDLHDAWEERRQEFRRRLDRLRSNFSHAREEALGDLEHFRKEVAAAYQHLEKALTQH